DRVRRPAHPRLGQRRRVQDADPGPRQPGARGVGRDDLVTRRRGEQDPREGIPVAFSSFRSNNPQMFLTVDRDRVQQMGVSVQAVNDALQSYMGQVYVNDITLDNRNWQVTVQADGPYRRSTDDLSRIKVRGPN